MIVAQFSVSCQYHEAIYQDIYADIYQDMETTIQQPNLYVITFALNAYSIYIYKRIPIYLPLFESYKKLKFAQKLILILKKLIF